MMRNELLFQIIPVLLLIPGFWLGWKILPLLVNWFQKNPNYPIQLQPAHKILLWLTVGSLFSNTLNFLYGFFYSSVNMLITPGWCFTQPDFMTRVGKISSCLHVLLLVILFLIIFAFVFKICFAFIRNQTTKINKLIVIILVLTIAQTIFQVVQLLFTQLLSFR